MTGEGLCCRTGDEEELGGSANAGPAISRPDANKAKRMRMTFLPTMFFRGAKFRPLWFVNG
jgi:hypothetical protein